MYEQFAKGYRQVEQRVRPEIEKAVALSRMGASKGVTRTRVRSNDNAPVIPQGSVVAFKPTDLANVRPGSFVFLRQGRDLLVRRLVRVQVTPAGLVMYVATADGQNFEKMPPSNLLGVVTEVAWGDQTWEPASRERGMDAWRNYWTEYGTIPPSQKLKQLLSALLPTGVTRPNPKEP